MLIHAISEIEKGHYEAHLAANLYKKRIALLGRGKRGGARTLIAMRKGDRAFFLYGFAKNKQASISNKELEVLKNLAHDYLNLSDLMLVKMLKEGFFSEVKQ